MSVSNTDIHVNIRTNIDRNDVARYHASGINLGGREDPTLDIKVSIHDLRNGFGGMPDSIENTSVGNLIRRLLQALFGGGSGARLPSEASAARTMHEFMKTLPGDKLISADQMKQMADTGYLNGNKVPDDVQQAAKRYMANGGEMFKVIERALTGESDGKLGLADPVAAMINGDLRRFKNM